LVLQIDQYKNIISIMGLRWNGGQVWSPKDFLIYTNLGMFGNPTGISSFRAAYSRWWFLDTVIKLRAMGAESRAFPFIWGTAASPDKLTSLQQVLAKAKSLNYAAVPAGTVMEVMDLAASSSEYFASFRKDCQEEIFLAINLATLQALTSGPGQQRGSSVTHKDTADLAKWYLSSTICNLLNDHENGLIPDMLTGVGNFRDVAEYPYATLSGVDDAELAESIAVDKGLQEIGWKHSKKGLEQTYGRVWPTEPEDTVEPPQQQQQGGAMGGGFDDLLGGAGQNGHNGDGRNGSGIKPPELPKLGQNGERFGSFAEETFHGPKSPGPDWVYAGKGPRGGKMWKRGSSTHLQPGREAFDKLHGNMGRVLWSSGDTTHLGREDGSTMGWATNRLSHAPEAKQVPTADLPAFAKTVNQLAAQTGAEDRHFDNKAFISSVWRAYQAETGSNMNLDDFKTNLLSTLGHGVNLSRIDMPYPSDNPKSKKEKESHTPGSLGNDLYHTILIPNKTAQHADVDVLTAKPHAGYSEGDWVPYRGERNRDGWQNSKTGQIVYGDKPSVKSIHDEIRDKLHQNVTAADIKNIAAKLQHLSRQELEAIKDKLGIKAGGTIADMAARIAGHLHSPTFESAQIQAKHLLRNDAGVDDLHGLVRKLSPQDQERLAKTHGMDTDNFIFKPQEIAKHICERAKENVTPELTEE
jgi:hypothetical protein